MLGGYSVAQFWGVAQRRRRIALVADFRGQSAPEILFERKSMFGDFEACGKPGEKPAASPGICADMPGAAGFSGGASQKFGGIGYQEETAPTLRGAEGSNRIPCVFDARGNGCGRIAPTMAGDHQSRITDYTAICIQGNSIGRSDTAGCSGKGWTVEQSYTLNTVDRHAVSLNTVRPPHAVGVRTPARVPGRVDGYRGMDGQQRQAPQRIVRFRDVQGAGEQY